MYSEAYSLSLSTRLSLRTRGTVVTLLAETRTFYLGCQNDWRTICADTKLLTIKLPTHVVTLGTGSTDSSLSSSRTTRARETGSTSNTSSTLWDRDWGSQNTWCAGSKWNKYNQWVWYLQENPYYQENHQIRGNPVDRGRKLNVESDENAFSIFIFPWHVKKIWQCDKALSFK